MITSDFTKIIAPLKRDIHGSNGAIKFSTAGIDSFEKEYSQLRFSIARTHDWPLWNQGQRCIDTHFVFPLEHLDPKVPENYVFGPTDELISRYTRLGEKILYRLGTSIEHSDVHFNALMPKDFNHYAEILAGIVRHYTRGWANGFHYDMMFEIWNEADLGEKMWSGTLPQFEQFFATVLARLKSEFPDVIIGGPAYTTHYTVYLENLLKACAEKGVVPDFVSWHTYAYTPEFVMEQTNIVRKLLDDNGFKDTKTCLDEWHYLESWDGISRNTSPELRSKAIAILHSAKSAVFNLAVLAGWQTAPMDMACYYGASPDGNWGYRNTEFQLDKNYFSMKLYGDLLLTYAFRAETITDDTEIYSLAAVSSDRSRHALLVADWNAKLPQFQVNVACVPANAVITALVLDETHDLAVVPVVRNGDILAVEYANSGPAACLLQFSP